ncbi:MAG TPA: hypothetical protein VEQ58_12635 [Polyangiaceae bacterium]|nr:hypothetical protein [Polyangiaceae bacterium]
MTRDRDEPKLDLATLRALCARDDLLPTTEAEVERAEGSLPELELPERLRRYRAPQTPQTPQSTPRRTSPLGYVVALGVGALVAAAATALWLRAPQPPRVTSAGAELVRPSPTASAAPVPLVFQSRCERECCAGSECKAAAAALSSCPSGIRCASCATDNVSGGPYRLRLGSLIVTEAGQKLLPSAPLELCVSTSASEALCVPALGEANGDAWRLLRAVTPLQGLLTGLSLELRKKGEAAPLGSWKRAVSPTPDVMCKGLAIAIQRSDGGETLGRLSAFIEPTHFVELSRAAGVPELLSAARHFEISGSSPRIYESSRLGRERFALVLGPFDRADADALRWQVLDHGLEAQITTGLDFLGAPRPAR